MTGISETVSQKKSSPQPLAVFSSVLSQWWKLTDTDAKSRLLNPYHWRS
jgi:hypothetical protein